MLKHQLAAMFAATIVATIGGGSTQAALAPELTTYVTFGRSVALPGVELAAGTYVFELADPGSNNGLVRVLSRDRRKVFTRQFTITSQRPASVTNDHGITFGEAPVGVPRPIKAWYPGGEATGFEFIYGR